MVRACRGMLALLVLLPALAPAAEPHVSAPTTADEVVRKAEAAFAELKDYQCLVESETRLGNEHREGVYRFSFKKPAMLRLRVLQGSDRGSEVAIDAEGKIRGHTGGLLKGFVINLKPDDRRLRDLRGTPITELDWGSFYRKLRERAALPGATLALPPRSNAEAPFDVTLHYTQSGKAYRELYRVDPRLWIMTEGDVYEDEVRVQHVLFRDVKLDSGLEDGFFHL